MDNSLMNRLLRAVFTALLLPAAVAILAPAPNASAQDLTRRIVETENADFFGGDYDVLKDVTRDACHAACLGDDRCRAFTYNLSAGWCFLKESVGELRATAGAVSGQVVAAAVADPADIAARRAELAFLPKWIVDDADGLSAEIGRRSPAGADRGDLVIAASEAFHAGKVRRAADLFRDALALEPGTFVTWRGLLAAIRNIESDDWRERQDLADEEVAVAVNAYLTADSVPTRAQALRWLGDSLGRDENWKPAIRAYRASLALVEDAEVRGLYERTLADHGFRMVEHRIDSEAVSPQICLVFSDEVATDGLDAGDFVRVAGHDGLAVSASGTEICIDGVEHGGRYAVTVRSGLPAADGEVTARQVALDIYIRDRAPSVRFPGIAYVLPGHENGAIPVATVNVSTVEAKLYRVGDRSLARTIGDGQFLSQLNDYQGERIAEQTGELVWEGTVAVEEQLNTEVVNAIPVSEIGAEIGPGAYVLIAAPVTDTRAWEARATQWFIVTDLGLSTYAGDDGFHVMVRSLTEAAAVGDVSLRLVAVNNAILGTAETDGGGHARFDPGLMKGEGGLAPALLVAELDAGEGDYAFLDLTRSEIDLSDRGVDGREPPGPLDVYLTADRGICRPGETVHVTSLVRDATALAVDLVPLTLLVHRPDGKEAERRLIGDVVLGGAVSDIAIAADAMRGGWRAGVYADPEGEPLAEVSWLVEDFLPERLDFDLAVEGETVGAGRTVAVSLDARHLYGAPLVHRTVSGRVTIEPVRAIDGYPGYVFGLAEDEERPPAVVVDDAKTDTEGHAVLRAELPSLGSLTRPATATFFGEVLDAGGRPVQRTLTVPVADDRTRLGIRPLFEGAAAEDTSVGFAVIALAPEGSAAPATADWTLSRVENDFQWYRENGRWNYRLIHRKRRLQSGTVTLGDRPAQIDVGVAWGGYELAVSAGGGVLPASYRFEAGWRVEARALDTPETLKVALDRQSYRVGDTVAMHITPPFAGRADILVADSRIIARRSVAVPAEGTTIEFQVTEEWGAGAYLLATLFRPMDLALKRMPARAMGLAWAGVDPGDRRLDVVIEAADTARPRGDLPVTVRVANLAEGDTAYVTLAAVDAGILNLTGYEAPDPDGWYFGQPRLGVAIRDFYNQLIDRTQGVAATVRSGGDASMMRLDGPPPPETLMAFHSGIVEVDDNGEAAIDVPIPDFNGTVRLMAMAWSADGVGHAVKESILRDPVVVAVTRPRFLAPGDISRLLIDLDNVERLAGEARLSVTADPGIFLFDSAGSVQTVDLDAAARQTIAVPVASFGVGAGEIVVQLDLPGGEALTKRLVLDVRNNAPPVQMVSRFDLAPGATLTLDAALGQTFMAEGWSATLTATAAANLDIAGIVRSLDLYPYGCAEQITSRALPLVYLDEVALAAGLASDTGIGERVDKAIGDLVGRQDSAGGFALWRNGSGNLWLDAYVTDFLGRAREAGYEVPDVAFRLALDNLKNRLAYAPDFSAGGEDVAYGLLVLARHGEAAISDLRYYANVKLGDFATPLAKAQVGAALMHYGDRPLATRLFGEAIGDLDDDEVTRGYRVDYGSPVRDGAAILTLASEAGFDRPVIDLLGGWLAEAWATPGRMSTQDQAWSLLAAHALTAGADEPRLRLGGERRDGNVFETFSDDELLGGVDVVNVGSAPVYVTLTRRGVPSEPLPAGGDFATLERAYYDIDTGAPVDPAEVGQGRRLVVVLSALFGEDMRGRMILDDPLPAGFEIDNPNVLRSGDIAALDWLQLETRTQHAEFRDDRFIVAFDRGDNAPARQQFAYVVRAVSPGSFAHPAAVLEDMYRPDRQARTGAGTVVVAGGAD